MLVLITGSSEPTRVQCAFVDTPEVEDIVNYVGAQVLIRLLICCLNI